MERTTQENLEGNVPFKQKFRNDLPWLCVMGVIFSLLGWLLENTAKFVGSGTIDSRFHLLPFIAPYSLVIFAYYLLLGEPNRIAVFGRPLLKKQTKKTAVLSNLLCFVITCAIVFVGELLVGNLWDLAFGVELWNYNNHPLHVTKFTSVRSSVLLGGAAYLVFALLFHPALRFFKRKMPRKVARIVGYTLLALIWLDTLGMALHIIITGEAPVYWSVKLR